MSIVNFNYDTLDEERITENMLLANATFDANDIFLMNSDLDCCSVTVITLSQRVSVAFEYSNSPGGNAGMTDIILSRIYPDYIRSRFMCDQTIYARNADRNVFILTGLGLCMIFLPENYSINQFQYNSLKRYLEEIKEIDYVKKGGLIAFKFVSGNQESVFLLDKDKLDEKVKELKNGIVEREIPKQFPIGELDFSKCKSEEEIIEKIKAYMQEVKQGVKKKELDDDMQL